MNTTHSIVAVLCDHQCSAKGPLPASVLESRLSGSSTIGKLVVLDKACRDPEKKLKNLSGSKFLFAGCRYLEESGFYSRAAEQLGLHPGEMMVTDVKSSILDLYESSTAIEDNLVGRLESLGRLLADSVALKDRPVKLKRNVLVFGSGLSGLKAALELSGEKITVDLVETEDPPLAPGCLAGELESPGHIRELREQALRSEHIAVFPQRQMGPIESVEKGFMVSFNRGQKREYGTVVYAPERLEATAEEIGAWNLTQLYQRIQEGRSIKGKIVFILDRHTETPPEIIRDILTAAKALKQRSHAEIWILLKQMRVALPGLQELYDLSREMGLIFVKYRDLQVKNEFGDIEISGRDPQSGGAFFISNADRVIIPGKGRISTSAKDAAADLGLRLFNDAYTQPYSLWRLTNQSNHPGVLLCGSARGNMDAAGVAADAASVAQALKARLQPEGITPVEHLASVDTDKCIYCLTCLRVCPYQAMGKNLTEKVAQPVTTACQGCGICAAECPAEAITIRNLSQESVLAAMHVL